MHSKYYSRFQLFTHNPLWKKNLRWAYQRCIDDLGKINHCPNFSKKNFTALLCGTSGEKTSSIFVNFVLSKNKNAKIIILDISETQLVKSKSVLTKQFPKANIKYVKADAKNTEIKTASIDYIETDGFLEYFDADGLLLLLNEWKRLLSNGGFVTTRAFASNSFFGKITDKIRVLIGKHYLNVTLHVHHMKDIIGAIRKTGLDFVQGGGTFFPTFKRFSLLKKK